METLPGAEVLTAYSDLVVCVVEESQRFSIYFLQSHLTSAIFAAPDSQLSDGVIFLWLLRAGVFPDRRIPRKTLIDLLMRMDSG